MENQFRQVANRCGLLEKKKNPDETYKSTKEIVDIVYLFFSSANIQQQKTKREVLFVFDGADNQNLLFQFLPQAVNDAPHILITSQCTVWDKRFDSMELDVFPEDEAFQFFIKNIRNHQPNDNSHVRNLLRQLSYHPLALQQAVSYINKNGLAVNVYIELLEGNKKAIHSEQLDQVQRASVYNTLSLSINNLKALDTDAYDLLTLMTHLDGNEMKKRLFLHIFNRNLLELNKSLSLLRKYSLVSYASDGTNSLPFDEQVVLIHSLTQDFLEIICEEENQLLSSLALIANFFYNDLKTCKENYKIMNGKYWQNHFHFIVENEKKSWFFLKEFANHEKMFYLHDMFLVNGNISKAIEVFEYMKEQLLEESDVNLLVVVIILSILYKTAGSNSNRRDFKLLNELKDRLTNYQNKDQGILNQDKKYLKTMFLLLAECYRRQGNFDEAIKLYQEFMEVQLRTNGPQHNYYLDTKYQLAFCYENKGKFNKAAKVYQEVMEVQQETIGPQQKDYLNTKSRLADCYKNQGDFNKAIKLCQEVIEVKRGTIGPKHENYTTTKFLLAECYQDKGNFNEAIKLCHEIMEVQHLTNGLQQENYTATKFLLALCYKGQRKFDEGIKLCQEIMEVQRRTIGPKHEKYTATKFLLAECYQEQGNFNEAIKLLQEIMEVQHGTSGPDNENYTATKFLLAHCYKEQGKFNEAIELLQEIMKVQHGTIGPQHEKYTAAKFQLAECYQGEGKFNEAIKLYQEIMKVQHGTIRPQNKDYLKAKCALAVCYQKQGKL